MDTWPIFDVTVAGWEPKPYQAPSRGQALVRCMSDYSGYDDRITFKRFMGMARVRLRREPLADDGYGYIRRAYGVNPKVGQRCWLKNEGQANGLEGFVAYPNKNSTAHVRVILDDPFVGERETWVHPMNIDLL